MIKFLLLLPVKLLGLVFVGIGEALKASEARRREVERIRVAQAKAGERERIRREREAARATKSAQTEATRIQREAKQREVERIRVAKAAERVREADADLAHLDAMREDCRKLAEYAEALLEGATTDSQKEVATKKLMAANQKLRSVDRQRERLQFIISTGGR